MVIKSNIVTNHIRYKLYLTNYIYESIWTDYAFNLKGIDDEFKFKLYDTIFFLFHRPKQ